MADTMHITWADLERGHRIVGGWKVADLTATHITVADEEDGTLTTFRRKDPWEKVEIIPLPVRSIVEAFNGHLIQEEVEGQPVSFFAWPDDKAFINAAQSHLIREHEVEVDGKTYDELRALHHELHERNGSATHQHIDRED